MKMILLKTGVIVLIASSYGTLVGQVPSGSAVVNPDIELPSTARVAFVALGAPVRMSFGKASQEDKQRMAEEQGGDADASAFSNALVVKSQGKGVVPPSSLTAIVSKEQVKMGMINMPVPIGFNHFRGMRKVYAGNALKFFKVDYQAGEELAKELYFELPAVEPDSETIVFLHPSGDQKAPWKDKPKFSKIELTHEDIADKAIVIRNMSREKIRVSIVKDTFDLKPGEMRAFDGDYDSGRARVRVGAHSDGKIAVNENVRIVEGNTCVLVVTPSGASSPNLPKIKMFKAVTRRATKPELVKVDEPKDEEVTEGSE